MKKLILSLPVLAGLSLLQPNPATSQDAADGTSSRTYRSSSSKTRDSVPPLFIEFTPASSENAAAMDEDLSVMSRLIDKAVDQGLGEDAPPTKLKLPLLYTVSGRSVRAMYLEGFGALFMIKVNFPVVAPPKATAGKEDKVSNSEWDVARRELREDDPDDEGYVATLDPSHGEADVSQIDSLKKVLLNSFKHAANIRGLKPDEFVAISVFGNEPRGYSLRATVSTSAAAGQATAQGTTPVSKKKAKNNSPESPGDPVDAPPQNLLVRPGQPAELSMTDQKAGQVTSRTSYKASKAGSQGTVLTVRARKADVDAFAKGELNVETFQAKTVFNSYVGNGYGLLSVNSWAGTGRSK
jgi:hypothetical protein